MFDNEPNIDKSYLDLPNAFLAPCIGSLTWDSRVAMALILVDGIADWQSGDAPPNRIA